MEFLASAGAALGLSLLGLFVSLLPRSLEIKIGPPLGRLILLFDKRRRGIIEENLRRCLPDADRPALLRANYEHYGILALEILHIFSPIPGHYRRYAEKLLRFHGLDHWKKAHAKGRGVILLTGHFANWELSGHIGSHIDILMATQRLKPKWVNDKIERSRHSLGDGARTAYGKRILPTLIKQLKAGETVGFVLDQYAPPPMGVPAKFFGATVDTQGAISLLVQRTGAAVVAGYSRRDEKGLLHFVVEPEIPLTPAQLEDPSETATLLAAHMERFIRNNPTQWLWAHRRFKHAVWPS